MARYLVVMGVFLCVSVALGPVFFAAQQPPSVMEPRSYDEPIVKTTVADLVSTSFQYHDRLVTVIGELQRSDMRDSRQRIYRLKDPDDRHNIRVAESSLFGNDLAFFTGKHVQVIGVFWDLTHHRLSEKYNSECGTGGSCFRPRKPRGDLRLRIFPPGLLRPPGRECDPCDLESFNNQYFFGVETVDPLDSDLLEDEEPEIPDSDPGPPPDLPPDALIDLRTLFEAPEDYIDRRIAVIGKFRGNNLYRDLPFETKKTPRDFVIKVSDKAIWVTGKRPPDLDPNKRRDTGKWLKIIGLPWMEEDRVYVKAEWIGIVPEPSDASLELVEIEEEADDAPTGPPPEILFTLPMDGERNIPLDTEFHVQFSKDMDPLCFQGSVELVYIEDDGAEGEFVGIEPRYEEPVRTLHVKPYQPLEPGRVLRLILYQGIQDEEGRPLLTRILSRRASRLLGPDSKRIAVYSFSTQS